MTFSLRTLAVCTALALTTLTACNKHNDQAASQQEMPPPTVEVQVVTLEPIASTQALAGRTVATETSEVRPQVSGMIDEILFQEGAMVQAGQPLYRINTDNYASSVAGAEAALNQARANVTTAQATLASKKALHDQAVADLNRMQGLLEIEAISRQAYDNAVTAVRTAEAGVRQAEANIASSEATVRAAEAGLAASQLDLNRTIVRAPLTGKSGISSVTKGALVSAGQANSLVTISRLDPIYVDIAQSAAEILRLREQLASGEASVGTMAVTLTLEDGSTYPATGQLTLSNAQVDETTGTVKLRAIFPNPEQLLLPGMYVNAHINQTVVNNATLLPQTAVTRTPQGTPQVYVVGADNKVLLRDITISGTHEGQWLVTGGLSSGDKVVTVGGAKLKPEQVVSIKPAKANATGNSAPVPSGHNSVLATAPNQTASASTPTPPAQPVPTPVQATPTPSAPTQEAPKPSAAPSAPVAPPSPPTEPAIEGLSPEEAEALRQAD